MPVNRDDLIARFNGPRRDKFVREDFSNYGADNITPLLVGSLTSEMGGSLDRINSAGWRIPGGGNQLRFPLAHDYAVVGLVFPL